MSTLASRPVDPRLAEQLAQVDEKPPLVPLDVWLSYQRERTQGLVDEAAPDSTQEIVGFHPGQLPDLDLLKQALAKVGLVDGVPVSALQTLARRTRQAAVPAGEYLFREGEQATSFYVVLEGTVEILRMRENQPVALRHIQRGESTGLFGLFSGQRRAACARAIDDVGVLEVPFRAVEELLTHVTGLESRLLSFYQERLLEGFLGSSSLFTDVEPIARARLLSRFVTRKLACSEALIQPGEVANQIAVLLSGSLILEHRSQPGVDARAYQVYPGEFVAITSAMSGAPCRMRVFALEESYVALLTHRQLADLLRDFPALRSLAGKLPSHARMLLRDVFCGHTGVPGL